MTELPNDGPCQNCGTSREQCDKRDHHVWPPKCCPKCRRARDDTMHKRVTEAQPEP